MSIPQYLRRYLCHIGFLIVVLFSAPTAAAQLALDGTVFLHGFNSSPSTWGTTPAYLKDRLYIKTIRTSKTDSTAAINTQRDQFRTLLNSYGGQQVLVGHSMGGLVARATYVANTSNVAGIVTVATPHSGTFLANNAALIVPWLEKVRQRVGDAAAQIRPSWRADIDAMFTGGFASVEEMANSRFGLGSSAVNDLKTTSPTIVALSSIATDAVPHANVIGSIPTRYALFRLARPADQFQSAVNERNSGMRKLVLCQGIGYATIIFWRQGKKCAKAARALARMDNNWGEFVTGAPQPIGGFQFDGVVPQSRALYPDIALGSSLNFVASGTHHLAMTVNSVSRASIEAALLAIGVAPRPPLNLTFTGPGDFTTSGTKTWTTSMSGADITPVTYHWERQIYGTTTWTTVGTNSPTYSQYVSLYASAFYLRVTLTSGDRSVTKAKLVRPETGDWCNPPPGQICPQFTGGETH